MCVGCEGLHGSNEIRAAFAAARGIGTASSSEPANLGLFGERLAPCPTLIHTRPLQPNRRQGISSPASLKPAPSRWWKLPRRTNVFCYAASSYLEETSQLEPTGARNPSLKVKRLEEGPKASAEQASPGGETSANHPAAKASRLSARDYWEFI